ncbi:775_t:CDS:2 [Paraglomus brasilianum]|uniref:775_t:CDS:1 n=1 Tax=Paraglomus brasilianum TaxID=144538 RepID=A0A9N8WMH2_9GLOM|nr:775_t:CDS:2 [Paraglomus brasilianum]
MSASTLRRRRTKCPDPRILLMLAKQYPNPTLTASNNGFSISCNNGTTFKIPFLLPAQFFATSDRNKNPNIFMVFRKLFLLSLQKNRNALSSEQKYVSILAGQAWDNRDQSARDTIRWYADQLKQYKKRNATPSVTSFPYVVPCIGCGIFNLLNPLASATFAPCLNAMVVSAEPLLQAQGGLNVAEDLSNVDQTESSIDQTFYNEPK